MDSFHPGPLWRAAMQARAWQPAQRPRVPLFHEAHRIGSVEPGLLASLDLPVLHADPSDGAPGWRLAGPLTTSLALLSQALRDTGRVVAWRDEALAVRDPQGQVIGAVERGVTRLLGIPTEAVHLLGSSPDGRHWLQQRALNKPDDPGLWDTLVGGMVPFGESVEQALIRETDEEAGLNLSQLQGLHRAGTLNSARPTPGTPGGYTIERITWYRATLAENITPKNRDGEVVQFRLMAHQELRERLLSDQLTLDAALMLTA